MKRLPTLLIALLCCGCVAGGRTPIDQVAYGDLYQRARDLLVRGSQSEDPLVRANALEALARVAPREALPYVRTSLGDGAPVVRFAACAALGDLRDTQAEAALKPLLNDSSEHVRLAAAYALYRLGDRQHAGLLVKTLADHPKEDLRSEAANLIGKCGDAKAIRRLELAERREKSPKALVHITAAKARLGDRAALDELLRAALGTEPITKLLATQFLIELKPAEARDVFSYRLKEDGDYLEARLLAARGLGALGVDAGYDLAVKSLRHNAKEEIDTLRVRALAALALGAIGDDRALTALQKLAADQSDARVQVAACTAICQILK